MMVRVGSLPRFEGEAPPSPPRHGRARAAGATGAPPNKLAVKVYRTGHSSDRGDGSAMREVMWEVTLPSYHPSHGEVMWEVTGDSER